MGVDLRLSLGKRLRPQYRREHRRARIALLQLQQNAIPLPPRLGEPAAARGLLACVNQRGQLAQRLAERLGRIVEDVELVHRQQPTHVEAGGVRSNADAP